MFADELFLFTEASIEQTERIKESLQLFSSASGLKVSETESFLYKSKNVADGVRNQIMGLNSFTATNSIGRYLGVPMFMVE